MCCPMRVAFVRLAVSITMPLRRWTKYMAIGLRSFVVAVLQEISQPSMPLVGLATLHRFENRHIHI